MRMLHLRFRRHFVSLKAFLLLREELYGQIYEAPKYVFVCQKHLWRIQVSPYSVVVMIKAQSLTPNYLMLAESLAAKVRLFVVVLFHQGAARIDALFKNIDDGTRQFTNLFKMKPSVLYVHA